MQFSKTSLKQKVLKGDMRAISRLISLTENNDPIADSVISELGNKIIKAQVIGVTGSPGAGKSTLVDQLAMSLHKSGKRVAIVAVDPSSPFSGGAILGDRIRMVNSSEAKGIFLRSMASRGALGGLAHAALKAIRILDAAAYEVIIIETVGVGQAEVDIVRCADTCLVVLVPGMGDSVQAIKAGILEIADIFVVNKSDREGSDLLERDLIMLMGLVEYDKDSWKPPIIKTVATEGKGIPDLMEKLDHHSKWLLDSKLARNKKERVIRDAILQFAAQGYVRKIEGSKGKIITGLVQQCLEKKLDPLTAASKLLK